MDLLDKSCMHLDGLPALFLPSLDATAFRSSRTTNTSSFALDFCCVFGRAVVCLGQSSIQDVIMMGGTIGVQWGAHVPP
jgi:hypothetical protein